MKSSRGSFVFYSRPRFSSTQVHRSSAQVEVGTSCHCRADVLARLSEALYPRPQNCIRDRVDIQELQSHSSLRSPPDRRKALYLLFLLRKRKIGSHASQTASRFGLQDLRRY